jgi:hypothetical protein
MVRNHFDFAYIKNKDCYVSKDDLVEMCKYDYNRVFNEYEGKMFCPDCKQARLELEFGNIIKGLRTRKKELHIGNCPHSPKVTMATQKQVDEYIKTVSPHTRERNLRSLLSHLNNTQTDYLVKTDVSPSEPPCVFRPIDKKATTYVYIPRQRIKSEKDVSSEGITKYYYGNLWLEIVKNSGGHKSIQLKLYPLVNKERSGRIICSIFILKNDNLSLVNKLIKETENGSFSIAFFGQMEKSNDGNNYNNFFIKDNHDFIHIPVNF